MTSVSSRNTGCVSCSSTLRYRTSVRSDTVSIVITDEIKSKADRVRDAFRAVDAVGV